MPWYIFLKPLAVSMSSQKCYDILYVYSNVCIF